MALAKRVSERENEAQVLEFFTSEDIQNNLTFLMLADSMLKNYSDSKQEIIVGSECIKTIYDILFKLKESHALFSAELFNDSENHTCGYINDVYNDLLIVDEVDSYGHKDGNAVFELDNITSIWFDSQELKKLETLI